MPNSDTYCGTAPFSEPESSSMRNNLLNIPNVRVRPFTICLCCILTCFLQGGIDFHTYGPLILHPFQYSYVRFWPAFLATLLNFV